MNSQISAFLTPLRHCHLLLLPLLLLLLLQASSLHCAPAGAGDGTAGEPSDPHNVYLNDSSVIRGYKRIVAMKSVWHYLGVPYAQPPLGELRFRPPKALVRPIGSASKPYAAFHKPCSCYYWPLSPVGFEKANPALMMWWNNTRMSEDCLYLNIWTPTASMKEAKAVMLWIYGGGFFGGSSSLDVYDGAVMAAKGDVVVVSMQYRMGALGFMHLDDNEAPGNVGLNDQLMAMQWVKKNIDRFGGDSNRITIFGESAGGVSVSYHLLSPYSQRYFNRAIMQSGTAIAWWASEDRAMARQRALNLANRCGCYIGHGDRAKIVRCLREIDVRRIQEKTTDVLSMYNAARSMRYDSYWRNGNNNADKPEAYMYFDLPFKPVYGTEFIPNDPMLILAKGLFKKTDLLMGVMKDEGIFWIVYALQAQFINNLTWSMPFWWNWPLRQEDKPKLQAKLQQNQKLELDPYQMVARYFITSININNPLTEAISFEYQVPSQKFGYKSWTDKNVVDAFDDLTGDRSFKCPVIDFADIYQEKMAENPADASRYNLWMYSFNHRTKNLPLPEWTGAMHGYELDYVFGSPFNSNFTDKFYTYTKGEEALSEDVIKFWTNFGKTGNPNTDDVTKADTINQFDSWPPYRIGNKSHLVFNQKVGMNFESSFNLRRRQCRFWSHHINNIRAYLKSNNQPCTTLPKPEPSAAASTTNGSCSILVTLLLLLAALLPITSQSEGAN